jgi:hypothetical protein
MRESEAEQFRNLAEECLLQAEKAISPLDKQEWLRSPPTSRSPPAIGLSSRAAFTIRVANRGAEPRVGVASGRFRPRSVLFDLWFE